MGLLFSINERYNLDSENCNSYRHQYTLMFAKKKIQKIYKDEIAVKLIWYSSTIECKNIIAYLPREPHSLSWIFIFLPWFCRVSIL